MDYTFEYGCPHCGALYIGTIEPPRGSIREEKTCDDCEKKFILNAFVEVCVETEKK